MRQARAPTPTPRHPAATQRETLTGTLFEMGHVPGLTVAHNALRYRYTTCACDIHGNGARILTRPRPPIGPEWRDLG